MPIVSHVFSVDASTLRW